MRGSPSGLPPGFCPALGVAARCFVSPEDSRKDRKVPNAQGCGSLLCGAALPGCRRASARRSGLRPAALYHPKIPARTARSRTLRVAARCFVGQPFRAAAGLLPSARGCGLLLCITNPENPRITRRFPQGPKGPLWSGLRLAAMWGSPSGLPPGFCPALGVAACCFVLLTLRILASPEDSRKDRRAPYGQGCRMLFCGAALPAAAGLLRRRRSHHRPRTTPHSMELEKANNLQQRIHLDS